MAFTVRPRGGMACRGRGCGAWFQFWRSPRVGDRRSICFWGESMTEEEARVELARLRAVAGDWARRVNASPANEFTRRQHGIAVERAERFAEEHLPVVTR